MNILKTEKPQTIANILNGKQTILVMKRAPKNGAGRWWYLYCNKRKDNLLELEFGKPKYKLESDCSYEDLEDSCDVLNGKVVARFWCDKIEEIKPKVKLGLLNTYDTYETETLVINPLLEKCCLSYNELDNYLKWKTGFAIHISKLEIFDRPKELNTFKRREAVDVDVVPDLSGCSVSGYEFAVHYDYVPLTKAPQNYCYCEVVE